jgi:hypothetical protein
MYLFILNKFMDMKAFRADLQQKSFNARKTNNYEDRLNVTYNGMLNQNSEEHHKAVSENLEKSVNFLNGVLHAAEYHSINVGMQNALRGRSNLYEREATPVPPDQFIGPPAPIEFGFTRPAPGDIDPPRKMPQYYNPNPAPETASPGDTYVSPEGYVYVWVNGQWRYTGNSPTPN